MGTGFPTENQNCKIIKQKIKNLPTFSILPSAVTEFTELGKFNIIRGVLQLKTYLETAEKKYFRQLQCCQLRLLNSLSSGILQITGAFFQLKIKISRSLKNLTTFSIFLTAVIKFNPRFKNFQIIRGCFRSKTFQDRREEKQKKHATFLTLPTAAAKFTNFKKILND